MEYNTLRLGYYKQLLIKVLFSLAFVQIHGFKDIIIIENPNCR